MLGRTISHYRIVSQLGAGGMGVVYGAEDVRLGRPVALKFVHDELARDRQAVERFQFEARAASALNHPNICTIHDIGDDEGRPFIVMELMKGQTLRDRLAASSLRIHHIVDIGIQIADALDGAHGQGIVHRDIKPANIFLTDRGQVKILDFGLAKLSLRQADLGTTSAAPAADQFTNAAITMGTVAYMSPEQVAGEELDGRTDLFSVGVVLYECATGHRPFTGNTSAVVLAAILNRAPVAPVVFKPDLPLRLQVIINNCLEKDRELRYQTAADLRADLKRARRDLESGHSSAVPRTVAPLKEPTDREVAVASEAPPVGARASAKNAAGEAPPGRAAASSPVWARRVVVAASVLAVALSVGGAYWLWPRAPSAPERIATPAVPPDRAGENPAPGEARAVEPPAAVTPERSARPASQPGGQAPAPTPPARRAPAPSTPPSSSQVRGTADPIRSNPLPENTAPAATSPPPAPPVIPAAPPPAAPRETTPATPPAPVQAERRDRDPVATAPPPAEDDEAAIRQVVATYARAIETKNLPLFRSVKPNLSREEERRIAEGFRAVSSQQVSVTILSIDRRGAEATVRLKRRDIIEAGGRRQTMDSEQTMTLARTGAGWVIVGIGR